MPHNLARQRIEAQMDEMDRVVSTAEHTSARLNYQLNELQAKLKRVREVLPPLYPPPPPQEAKADVHHD